MVLSGNFLFLWESLEYFLSSSSLKALAHVQENKDLGPDNGLIGQFGVGFYSAFLVAQKVQHDFYIISQNIF